MLITRESHFSGATTSRELPVTDAQIQLYNDGKVAIQHVFPNLSAEDREFIKTGMTTEEWDEIFGEEE